MIDYGTRHTDLAVKRTEWRLSRVYHQAERDIADKLKDWQEGHERREAKYRQQLAEGKITQADFDAWMRGQVFQEEQWKARQEQIRQTLLNADREAANIVNNGKLGVFAENANYTMYEVEQVTGINTGFTMYDEQTVARLIKDEPQILPKAAPGVKKDKAYTYYNKLMNSAITQGIVQGETIQQIARRIARVTGESSYKSAMRNARTAYTGAQNAGSMESMRNAQSMGIKVKKKWLAILDSKTRDAHADLDGQEQELDDPFESKYGPIDYPGDPTADPANVYNCRCRMVRVFPDYPSDIQRRDAETGEIVGDMTYREWEEMKQGGNEVETTEVIGVRDVEYGPLFSEDAATITRNTINGLQEQFPLSQELEFVGDVRVHRDYDPEEDIFDLHYNHNELTPAGAQYLRFGADGKSGPCIEVHNEMYSTRTLQEEFDERYALRLKYGDPMQPPTLAEAFFNVSDTLQGTLTHEYGHAYSEANGVFSGPFDNEFRQWQKEFFETHRTELLSISRYAASHPDEMFAEAFVQAQDTRHPDTLAYKLSREIMDEFERYRKGR